MAKTIQELRALVVRVESLQAQKASPRDIIDSVNEAVIDINNSIIEYDLLQKLSRNRLRGYPESPRLRLAHH